MLAVALVWGAPAEAVETDDSPAGAPIYHVVVADETVAAIARRYGSDIDAIIRVNKIADVRKLWVGTRLEIPRISGPEPEAPVPAPRAGDSWERVLERSEAQLREARFEAALAGADDARRRLDAAGAGSRDPRRVQIEVLAATAEVALGKTEAALASLERALQADPDLELDPAVVSPRVIAVLRAARHRIAER